MTATDLPVAILVATGFEERHLTEVQKALFANDVAAKIISPDGGLVQGWHEDGWGHHFMADDSLADVLSADFSALVVPAGRRSTAGLRQNQHTARLLKAFAEAEKPTMLLGDAACLLTTAEIAAGRRVANPGDDRELAAAGAEIVAEAIVVDGALTTTAGDVAMRDVLDVLHRALGMDDEVVRAA